MKLFMLIAIFGIISLYSALPVNGEDVPVVEENPDSMIKSGPDHDDKKPAKKPAKVPVKLPEKQKEIIKENPQENHQKVEFEDDIHGSRRREPQVVGGEVSEVYVERKYTCISNGKSCLLKKIILKNYFDITSKNQLRCNQEQCHPATYNYTYVDEAGKKSSMLIEYGIKIPRREVYVAGSNTLYQCGKILTGPCKGALACEIAWSPNEWQNDCSTKKGVTVLDTALAAIIIKNCGKDTMACFGGGYQSYQQGLINYW